jgi:hypothetical protein
MRDTLCGATNFVDFVTPGTEPGMGAGGELIFGNAPALKVSNRTIFQAAWQPGCLLCNCNLIPGQ